MDYYLNNPERLDGQPKRTIADYVESWGITVPKRFDSLSEARRSHKPVFIRSEHPLEYSEISGLLDSFPLSYVRGVKDESELKEYAMNSKISGRSGSTNKYFIGPTLLFNYCSLLNLDFNKIAQQFSFSFWEKLKGINRTIVADSSIIGRYHIQEMYRNNAAEDKSFTFNYFVVEDGNIIYKMIRSWNFEQRDDYKEIIELYEDVRNLPRFDPDNCPMIEVMTIRDKNYFLQYHRGREFDEAGFVLDRTAKDDEKEALFVRGHTPKEGIFGKITVAYADTWKGKNSDKWTLPKSEFGSFDFHYNFAFSTIMFPKRRVQMIYPSYKKDLEWELFKFVCHHALNSELFIPEVSVVSDKNILNDPHRNISIITTKVLSKMELYKLGIKAKETGEDQGIDIHLVSDGRKAFIRRL